MIKYLGYYDIEANKKYDRNVVLAATNKMSYIINVICKSIDRLEILSAGYTKQKGCIKGQSYELNSNTVLKLPFCIGDGNKLKRFFGRIIVKMQLMCNLILTTSDKDFVVVYHSLSYMKLVLIAKKIRKFKLIIEAEEVYGDVIGNKNISAKELKFFQQADGYIFPTELLDEKVNIKKKPSAIIYGTYDVVEEKVEKFNDGKIHCVYAGTFDPRKGGGLAAAAAGEFLDDNYHIHIIGFGSDSDKKLLLDKISETQKKTKCTITYDGLLSGDEYIKFIQSCHIGFSTQTPNGEYNDTSFPSKVLSYMANGLRVVSIRIKALERSAISDLLYYYEEDSPKAIAEAIKKIDLNDSYDSRETIRQLDLKFCQDIKNVIDYI